ncbi:MAG: HPr family phosphocarrier protein [Clostridiaceae bacterium]|jgi:phosphotransferase system HPr (HPr) family protein|nr:HPr family phosphocarrier protein [Clostridiaceae bacterium]
MISKEVCFACDEDTHMKSIALLIQKASNFDSSIYIEKDDRRANAKSLLGVMSLGIDSGDRLMVVAEGEDEEEAVELIVDYMADTNKEL